MANPVKNLFLWENTPVGKSLVGGKKAFVVVFWLTFFAELLSLAPIIYMINAFDRVISSRSMITLVSLTVLIVAVYIFWGAIEWIRSRLMVRLSLKIDWELGPDVFDASFRRHVGKKNVNIQQVLNDMLEFRQFLTGQPILALMEAPFAVIFIIVGAIVHPYLAAFIIMAVFSLLVVSYFTQKITTPILKEANDSNAEANRRANIFIRNSETTLALGMLPAARKHWYDSHKNYLKMQVSASESTGLMGGYAGFLNKAFPSLAIALGVYLAINNLISGGLVFAASMLISKAIAPLQKLMGSWKSVVSARQAYERLNELLSDAEEKSKAMPLPAPKGHLEVTQLVGVPTGTQKKVIDEVSFALKPGEAVAIVGTSASGKSSLAKLLIGVWKPAGGSVRLDGVELSDWNHDEVGPQIGYVPQEIEFFEGTIAENIARLGEVDSEKVVQAAKLVNMHEAILAFPEGYDTKIGDVATFGLSGGQRQRLAIARAIYGAPKYMVMDEPNANLDEIGEQALVSAIAYLKSLGSTIVVTTHRPRLIASVDYLLVLKGGKQAAFGPAKQVIESIRNLQSVPRPQDPAPTQPPSPAAPAAFAPSPTPSPTPSPAPAAASVASPQEVGLTPPTPTPAAGGAG